MTRLMFCLSIILLLSTQYSYAQEDQPNINAMSIPSSPAFSLLGVNPELVTRPSDVKEFKVDWRIKNYKLAPDLAFEAQPMWWLYYRNKSPKEFLNSSTLEKIFSTTTISLATAKIDNVNHLAYSIKFNLYKSYDPFSDFNAIQENEAILHESINPISEEIEILQVLKAQEKNMDSLSIIQTKIDDLKYNRKVLIQENMRQFSEECNLRIQENWNMDMVDFAFGKVYKYDNAGLDSLNFEKAGYGIWVNASKGIGKHGLWTGILKMNKIGQNRNYMLGTGYRFGSYKYNFFGELVLTKMNNVPDNGFDTDEQFAALRADDLGNGWYKYADGEEDYTTWTLSYGGDFKLSRNILLNFALRTELKGDLSFQRFLPVANIICLMK